MSKAVLPAFILLWISIFLHIVYPLNDVINGIVIAMLALVAVLVVGAFIKQR